MTDLSLTGAVMVTFGSTDDVLTLLIHLGYLGYDSGTSEVFIPNNEIRDEFKTSIKNEADWQVQLIKSMNV